MIIGCLTGKEPRPRLDGRYSYHAPGLRTPLDPDLQPDASSRTFADGALTGDDASIVAWSAAAVGDTGVDIVLALGRRCFVDRVIVRGLPPLRRQAAVEASPDTDNIEAAGHVEPDGISCAEVYATYTPADLPGALSRAGRNRAPPVLQA